jgi:membrane protease YdiL (CAAX protease family)
MNTPTNSRPGFPWAYTLMAYGCSWLVYAPAVLATAGFIPAPLPIEVFTVLLITLGAFGPLVAACTITAREEGRMGVPRLLARGRQWRIGLPAVAVIAGLPFAISAAARALDTLTGGTPPPFVLETPWALLPTFVFILLLGGPIQEEFGWRGYALPRLAARWGEMGASLILGVVWALWHLPFWWMAGAGMGGTSLPIFVLYNVGLSGVMTWLHERTGGSVLAAILMHTTANFVSNVLPTHTAQVHDSHAYLFQALLYVLVAVGLLLTPVLRIGHHAVDVRG